MLIVRESYDYHIDLFLALLDHLEQAIPQVAYTERGAGSFPSIAHTLAHIYAHDCFWGDVLRGQAPQSPGSGFAVVAAPSVEGLRQDFIRLHRGLITDLFWEDFPMDKQLGYRQPSGALAYALAADIFMGMAMHGAYHRGNAAAMLRQLGFKGVSEPFVQYKRKHHIRKWL